MAQEILPVEDVLRARLVASLDLMNRVTDVCIDDLGEPTDGVNPYPAVIIEADPGSDGEDEKSLTGVRMWCELGFRVFVIGAVGTLVSDLAPAANLIDTLLQGYQADVPDVMLIHVERNSNLHEDEMDAAYRDYPKLGGVYVVTVCPKS